MGRRFEAFLYSKRNLFGCLLALGGLALHFSGLIPGLQWLPITLGLYAIGVLLIPGERGLDLRLDAAADAAGVREAMDQLLRSISGRVPADIYAKVASIRNSILVTLGPNGNGTGGGGAAASSTADPNVYLIRQTALSYLPEALNTYLALPALYRDRRLGGRKSPHDTLLDQLNLMDQKMTEVSEAIVAHDADRLEAHGRFLAEKFGGSSLDIAQGIRAGAATSSAVGPTQAQSSVAVPAAAPAAVQAAAPAAAPEAVRPGDAVPQAEEQATRDRVRG